MTQHQRAEALAIDIGGTKFAVAWVDGQGQVRDHLVASTPPRRAGDPEGPWRVLLELVHRALDKPPSEFLGIGVGSAGPIDATAGTVSPVNIPGWRGFPIVERLTDSVVAVDVRLAGDGICATIGEHWCGAGHGSQNMLGVVVSTGVGGGLILDGRLHRGRTANAGHVGHMIVDVNGEPCTCGSIGCVETIASGPSLVRWARAQGWSAAEGATARELAEAARSGESVAVAAYDRAAQALAGGFVSTAAVCDLDVIVVGGGVALAGEVLFQPLRRWTARLGGLTFVRHLTIAPMSLRNNAGLVGAGALLHQPERYGTPGPIGVFPQSGPVSLDQVVIAG